MTTRRTHEFLVSGCRYQWASDHDSADCWRAFLAHRGAPEGMGVDEFYDWLDERSAKEQMIRRAEELEGRADLLRSALLAPSMKEKALRDEALQLRASVRP
jgi:hypothetical protein